MFIAHIPVGVALARLITRRRLTLAVIVTAAVGAVFPDFDLIRFYVWDNHQRHHHDYWTHIPAVWALIMYCWHGFCKMLRRHFGQLSAVFFAAVFSHMILDTMAGEIEWLWPFSDVGFNLVTVPATHAQWYLSFLTHWTFMFELIISVCAISVAFKMRR